MTFEEFGMYLENEFNDLKEANMLPGAPIVVETTKPEIPAGLESLVEDIRAEIDKEAEDLRCALGINAFAESFVCEETVKDLEELKGMANERLAHEHDKLDKILGDLFVVEGGSFENMGAFETHLRNLFEESA